MGSCVSGEGDVERAKAQEEAVKNVTIERTNAIDHERDSLVQKLLLLGAGESGKSTIFKQMVDLYGNGFSEKQKLEYIAVIHANLLISAKALSVASRRFAEEGKAECDVSEEVQPVKEFFIRVSPDATLDVDIASKLKKLWADPGIQKTFALRSLFQIPDGTSYLMTRLDECIAPGFVPSKQDILASRVRTTGILSTEFKVEDLHFQVFDVGGQRNERKKWIHCFENVTAVIFVVAASEYDQVLFEDDTTNRMVEALNLFEEVINSKWFARTSIILFLNKKDLFIKKLAVVPLRTTFPDYDGDNEYESAWRFLAAKFASRRNDSTRQIYTHVTCATDDTNVLHVFNSVKDIVIRAGLLKSGLM